MSKLTYVDIRNAQDQVTAAADYNRNAMTYMLGAYETLIASIVAYDLPGTKQREFIRSLESLKARVDEIANAKDTTCIS